MRKFLEPESVALIGVPRSTGVGAYNNLEILLRFGYQGEIYPVNPKAEEICGIRCFSSVLEIPKIVDLAVIAVGRDRVPAVFRDCCEKGIKRVVIISQGFADGDEKGKRLQEELTERAKEADVRIIGPNTMGVYNVHASFTTGFVEHYKPENPDPVCMVAQTGVYQVGTTVFSPNGFAKAIDLGNACDLDIVDVLEYLEDDPQTKVIAVHMEGIKRGRKFIEVARRVMRKKPVIILKTGRSTLGAKAALSHTGSLVGDIQVFDAAFKRAGVTKVRTNSELQDAIRAFVNFPPMKGNRITIISATGAIGIIATDACEDYGLELGPVPSELAEKILKRLPEWIQLKNPIDIWPIGMISRRIPQVFEYALMEALDSEDIDAVAIIWVSLDSTLHTDINFHQIVERIQKKRNACKPVAFWFYGDNLHESVPRYEKIPGVACFPTIERAIRRLSYSYHYAQAKSEPEGERLEIEVDQNSVIDFVNSGRENKILLGEKAFSLLENFGIPVVSSGFVKSLDEALDVAHSLGYPVVCKVSSEQILHKTETKAVVLDIESDEELTGAYSRLDELLKNVSDQAGKILVQKQISGHELLLGLKRDPNFGMVVVCGQGGIYTEVYRDITRSIVPVSIKESHDMLESLQIYPILRGVRGRKGVDLNLLSDMICRMSALGEHASGLREADINPLIVNEDGCWAVDARFLWA